MEGGRTAGGRLVGSIVVFCKDAGTVLRAEDYDGIDGEQGHAGRHDCGVLWLHAGVWGIYCTIWVAIKIANVVDWRCWCLGCQGFTRVLSTTTTLNVL